MSEQWMTYTELAAHWGCTANAARVRAQRRRWAKRAANRIGGQVHVLVPDGELVQPRALHHAPPFDARPLGQACITRLTGVQPHEPALDLAMTMLARQLERADSLAMELADAKAALAIASNEAARLRAELDRRQQRRWWWRG